MDNIPIEIIYLFFLYLNPIEAQQFSLVNKKVNLIYQNIKNKNEYISIDHKLFIPMIELGHRFIEINDINYKIINIISYGLPNFLIILRGGEILTIGMNKFLYLEKNKEEVKNIKLVNQSNFIFKIKSIKLRLYNIY
jgi:hypothetical protein